VDGSRLRGVFAEGKMSSRFVVVGKASLQDHSEVLLAEDNPVVRRARTSMLEDRELLP
jgi:hypothetical protein